MSMMLMMFMVVVMMMMMMMMMTLIDASSLRRVTRHSKAPAQMLDLSAWANLTVGFITAHPDDIEGCAGGTVALLRDQGTTVYYIIVTNGDKGCGSPICANFTSEQIAAARVNEAINVIY